MPDWRFACGNQATNVTPFEFSNHGEQRRRLTDDLKITPSEIVKNRDSVPRSGKLLITVSSLTFVGCLSAGPDK